MSLTGPLTRIAAAFALLIFVSTAQASGAYQHYIVGNPADVKRPTSGLIVLQGGGDDVDENYVRMGAKGGGGDFVVIRATGADEYNDYIYKLCKCDSVATLVVPSREAAGDPFIAETLRNAEALFIAGGDQGNYVRFWKGTPVQAAINAVIAKPAPIGGTSAGMASLSEFVYSALGEASLTSTAGLANPFDADLTLERDFLTVPILRNVVTDQHLQERDRIGRTLTLLARLARDGWSKQPRAIAADRETSVHIDPATGIAEVFATPTHDTPFAYFMSAEGPPARCEKGQPLTFGPVAVYRVPPGGRFDLGTWRGEGGIAYTLSAEAGVLRSSRGRFY
jgi:cyanophycinase